jgi:quinol monooxygenase YgiN
MKLIKSINGWTVRNTETNHEYTIHRTEDKLSDGTPLFVVETWKGCQLVNIDEIAASCAEHVAQMLIEGALV